MIFILLVLFIVSAVLIYNCNSNLEHFDRFRGTSGQVEVNVSPHASFPKSSFQEIARQNSINNNTAQLFNDISFRDVVIYDNDPDGLLGLEKCIVESEKNGGHCVEFGYTGVGYYYPDNFPEQYYGEIVNFSFTPSERRESTVGKMDIPNLR